MQDYEDRIGQINQACTLGELTNSEARKGKKRIRMEFGVRTPLERMIFGQAVKIATSSFLKAYVTYGVIKPLSDLTDYFIRLIK